MQYHLTSYAPEANYFRVITYWPISYRSAKLQFPFGFTKLNFAILEENYNGTEAFSS